MATTEKKQGEQKATQVTYTGREGAYMVVGSQRFDKDHAVEVTDADLLAELAEYPEGQFEIKG
jgi:hypothetical protein